jgi:hypothetical protein
MEKIIAFLLIAPVIILTTKAQNFIEVNTDIIDMSSGDVAWGDYDNDGDLDLYISGSDTGLYDKYIGVSKIYRNDNGEFTDIGADILGVHISALADWGDFDNDGDLDLLISGADDLFMGQSKVYRNDNGIFIDINADIKGFIYLSIAQWGDYDNDGDLDILIAGFSDEYATSLTKIYENINNTFYENNIQLQGVSDHKSAGWGDFDDDGDLDIFISGPELNTYSIIYVNNNSKFSKLTLNNIGPTVEVGCSDWGDFDKDGDLDLAFMGMLSQACCFPKAKIYRNDGNDFVDIEADLLGLKNGVIKWVDFDMDMDLDLFLLGSDYNDNPHCYLYSNTDSNFTFIPANISGLRWSVADFGDYDNDNDLDLIISGRDSLDQMSTKLYKNNVENKIIASNNVICGTNESVLIYYVGDTANIENFVWDFSGGEILDGSDNGPLEIKWDTTGDKNISLILIKEPGVNDTLTTMVSVFPEMSVSLGNDTTIEMGENITLHPVVMEGTYPFIYLWNNVMGDSVNTLNIIHDTIIFLKVFDTKGCRTKDTISIKVPENAFSEQICLVTVDNNYSKNMIVWEKTPGKNIKEYNILRETTVGSDYSVIGTVSFDNESIFIDQSSTPAQHANRYKLETINLNGYKIGESDFHQTIYLAINQGLPGTYNFIWTPYIGFDYNTYYIYKGLSPDNLQLVDSIANTYNQFTDTASGIAYYQIAVHREQACNTSLSKSTNALYSKAVSNIAVNQPDAINKEQLDYYFDILPNPFDDELNIRYSLFMPSKVIIEIYNIIGTKIYEYRTKQNEAGVFRHIIPAARLSSSNVNIVKLEINGKSYFIKAIKK